MVRRVTSASSVSFADGREVCRYRHVICGVASKSRVCQNCQAFFRPRSGHAAGDGQGRDRAIGCQLVTRPSPLFPAGPSPVSSPPMTPGPGRRRDPRMRDEPAGTASTSSPTGQRPSRSGSAAPTCATSPSATGRRNRDPHAATDDMMAVTGQPRMRSLPAEFPVSYGAEKNKPLL